MSGYYYATKALCQFEICELPITAHKIEEIIKRLGWEIKPFDLKSEKHLRILDKLKLLDYAKRYKAFSYLSKKNDLKVVFYNVTLSSEYKLSVLTHELGHIVQGHFSDTCILGVHINPEYDEVQEIEANEFARNFLAHPLILKRLNVCSIEAVCKTTLIDKTSAKIQLVDSRSTANFLTEAEKCILNNMRNFIKKNKYKKIFFKKIIMYLMAALLLILTQLVADFFKYIL